MVLINKPTKKLYQLRKSGKNCNKKFPDILTALYSENFVFMVVEIINVFSSMSRHILAIKTVARISYKLVVL